LQIIGRGGGKTRAGGLWKRTKTKKASAVAGKLSSLIRASCWSQGRGRHVVDSAANNSPDSLLGATGLGGAESAYLLLVVFFLFDDLLAFFFAMALSPPFLTTNCKSGKVPVNANLILPAHFFPRGIVASREKTRALERDGRPRKIS
jgi:hypothetical protein